MKIISLKEDLTEDDVLQILNDLKDNKKVKHGPKSGRFSCEPFDGLTCLTTEPPRPGFKLQDVFSDSSVKN